MLGLQRVRALLLVGVLILSGCAGFVPADDASAASSPAPASESPSAAANGTLEVHFVNVGQSVSTLVVGPDGETMLVDTGHYHDDGEHVLDYLERHGIKRIDHLVVSHNDADHIGGNAAIIEHFEMEADGIGAVYDPGIAASTQTYGAYLDAVEDHDVTLYETREGDAIQFGGDAVDVDVLGPPEPYLEDGARNENSVVLKLTHGASSFLLPGDAEDDQEAYLVDEYGDDLNATVLKAGHHGSASSTSGALLDAVSPEAVVVSSAYDSQYGHPSEAVLQRLANRSLSTYWTATHGDTVFVSNGTGVSVWTQQSAPTAPLELREGDPVAPGASNDTEQRARLGGDVVANSTEAAAPDTGATATAVTDGGTIEAAGQLTVAEINADAAGDDRENLNDEYVVFRNDGSEPIDLSGWTVADEVGKTYAFPEGYALGPGETVTLHTGSGTDTEIDLYWGSGSPVWNNGGDTVIMRNSDGERVLREAYA